MLPPINVSGYGLNATSSVVTWEDVPLIGRNGIIKGFLLNYSYVDLQNGNLGDTVTIDVNNSTYDVFVTNTDASNTTYSVHLTNLTRDSFYNISVAAYTDVGVGVFSFPEMIETGPYSKNDRQFIDSLASLGHFFNSPSNFHLSMVVPFSKLFSDKQ